VGRRFSLFQNRNGFRGTLKKTNVVALGQHRIPSSAGNNQNTRKYTEAGRCLVSASGARELKREIALKV